MRPPATSSSNRRQRTARAQVAPSLGSPPRGAGHAPVLPQVSRPPVMMRPTMPMLYDYDQPVGHAPNQVPVQPPPVVIDVPPPRPMQVPIQPPPVVINAPPPPPRQDSYSSGGDGRTRRSRSSSQTATYVAPAPRPGTEPIVMPPPPIVVPPAESVGRSYGRRRSPSPPTIILSPPRAGSFSRRRPRSPSPPVIVQPARTRRRSRSPPVVIEVPPPPPPRSYSYDGDTSMYRGRSPPTTYVQQPPVIIPPAPAPAEYVRVEPPDGPFSRARFGHGHGSPPTVIIPNPYPMGGHDTYAEEPWSRRYGNFASVAHIACH